MTQEELEKKALDFELSKHYRYEDNDYCGDIANGIIQAYIAGAKETQEDFERFKKGKVCDLCNYNTVGQDEYIDALEEQVKELEAQIKVLEDKDFEKCPFRYSDMGCDYCDWRDRDLKDEWEVKE